MFIEDLKKALRWRGRMALSVLAVAAMGVVSVQASEEDEWEDECELAPSCEVEGVMEDNRGPLMYIPECYDGKGHGTGHEKGGCSDGSFSLWLDGLCPDSRKLKIRIMINGSLAIERTVMDQSKRQKAYFEIPNFEKYEKGDTIAIRIKIIDLESGETTNCGFRVEVICGKPPTCYFNGDKCDEVRGDSSYHRPVEVYDVKPGDYLPEIEFCAISSCGERARVEMFARPPFMKPAGHRKGSKGERVCLTTRSDDIVEAGFAEGTYWAKFKCTDVRSGRSRVIKVGYRYTDPQDPEPEPCSEDPICEILGSDSISVPIDGSELITVCGSTLCEDCEVTVAATSLPSFVTVYEGKAADGAPADGPVCVDYLVSPTAADAGAYTAVFTVTDCEGNTSECSVEINVPEPLLACTENEDQLPNDSFDDASIIDSGECADAFGVNLYGVLDAPVFKTGDVDYFRVVGLTPNDVYVATIVAGFGPENVFTDTMLGWVAADGVVVAMDDDSGPLLGYSKVTFTADENGVATLAVSGHGDDDFNGAMDASMAYEEYGFGGYMLSIRAEVGDVMPVERQADLNGDGVVNTADLGMLIGVFGASSN